MPPSKSQSERPRWSELPRPPHLLDLETVFSTLATSHHGLNSEEALQRLAQHGFNRLSERPRPLLALRLGKHLVHPFALLLLLGAALCFLADSLQQGQGMHLIGNALIIVVLLNAAFTYWQEAEAERAMAAFRRMQTSKARVVRGGREEELDASLIVPGDIVILREGDGVPADGRLFELHALKVNNASLTGESEPQLRSLESAAPLPLQARNLVFSGTLVSAGSGLAVVFATGDETELGKIAGQTLATTSAPTPMQRELRHFVQVISKLAIALGVIFFLLGQSMSNPFWDNLIFAIGIIVANVPEGLLPTVTLALSLAAARMARRRALVKSLEAVETLGRTTVICTDKTGTLTSNVMQVQNVSLGLQSFTLEQTGLLGGDAQPANPASVELLARASLLCNNATFGIENGVRHIKGDPTECALLSLAETLGYNPNWIRQNWPRILEAPFSGETCSMVTVTRRHGGGETIAWLKGAPEVVLGLCTAFLQTEQQVIPLEAASREAISKQSIGYASQGYRVLGVAYRELAATQNPEHEIKQPKFTLLGLVALHDPPRAEVPDAVSRCQRAGIRVIVVSGDHPLTVESIAHQVGILRGTQEHTLLTGDQISRMGDPELRQNLAAAEIILARTSASDKLRVVELLQKAGETVAVTGDGVNDAPALKKADIGVAMGLSGTEVAKEAADIVLMDDNFNTIVAAIEEGRVIYGNIRKFIAYVLTSNVPEIIPYIAYVLLDLPLPLTILLILAIDLGTDLLPALGLATEPPEEDVMELPPLSPRERLVSPRLLCMSYGIFGMLQTVAGFSAYFAVLLHGGWIWGRSLAVEAPLYRQAVTAFFVSIVVCQVGNVMACRTRRQSVFTQGLGANRVVLCGIVLELSLAAFIVYAPTGQTLFQTAPLPLWAWLIPLPFAITILGLEELRKWLRRRGNKFVEAYLTW